MTAVVVLASVVIFVFGAITGTVVLVCLASYREDRRARLSRAAPDRMTMAGRFLTNLYVRRPGDIRNDYTSEDRAELLDEERRDCDA